MSSWVGTLAYMSPERLKGDQYRSDTDIWSLGIVLLECAFGEYPYKDKNGFWEMLQEVTQSTPIIPDEFSDEFKDLISICLKKESAERKSATELLQHSFCLKYADCNTEVLQSWLQAFLK